MKFLSVCSGIEAASCALAPLGYEAVGFAEVDGACARLLAHRFPDVPNLGDFTAIDLAALPRPLDLLIGGTPCQAFSVAGKRLSLADARGNLALAFVALAHELARSHALQLAWWENVPGVLNTPDDAFGCFLGGLVGADNALHRPAGERWPDAGMVAGPRARAAWRILDAQYFGLAQRRRRVFVVASFRTFDPAAILFERQGVQGNPPPRREAREELAGSVKASSGRRGGVPEADDAASLIVFGGNNTAGPIEVATALSAYGGPNGRQDFDSETFVAFTQKDRGQDADEGVAPTLRAMTGAHANAGGQVAVAFAQSSRSEVRLVGGDGEMAGAIAADLGIQQQSYVAFDLRGREGGAAFEGPHPTANIRAANGGSSSSYVADTWGVRRLTPTECERLQGFPDGWTATPDAKGRVQADGPRYKQLGNSMAVPVIAWIGRRILLAAKGVAP